jgi:cell division topological specificity factor
MTSLLDRVLGRGGPKGSGATAKQRLQFTLIHDRINISPERMEMMKQEILAVIAKYVDVEGNGIEVALQKRDRSSMLVAEVPFSKPVEGIDPNDDNR